MLNTCDAAGLRRAAAFSPDPRVISALGLIVTPAGRALADDYARKLRLAEAVMPPLLRASLQQAKQGGPARVYGLPLLAL